MNKPIIPIFYACDDGYVKFVTVSLYSMMQNASKDYYYNIHILHNSVKPATQKRIKEIENDNFSISFIDVSEFLGKIVNRLPIRDYYNMTTYFRFFIAEMFPEYDKAIYIDGDTVVQGDIS